MKRIKHFIYNHKLWFKPSLMTALLGVCVTAQAGVYKCTTAGKTTYQSKPCAAKSVQRSMDVTTKSRSLPWSGLKLGMSVKQVQKAVQSTQASNDRVVSGAKALVVKPNVQIGGVNLTAKYYFKAQALTQINLNNEFTKNDQNKSAYQKILSSYQQILGAPSNQKDNTSSSGLSMKAEWFTEQGRVWLSVMPVTSRSSMITTGIKLK